MIKVSAGYQIVMMRTVWMSRKICKIQTLLKALRARFQEEYLEQLKVYGKEEYTYVNKNGLILIGRDNLKRMEWLIGIVIELFP